MLKRLTDIIRGCNLIASGITTEASDAEFIIPNTPGTELPRTGGSGTKAFTILGGVLTLLSAGYLLLRRWGMFA